MKRTTINLTDELAGALEREARRRDVSMSEVARVALSEHFGIGGSGTRSIPFAGIARSGKRHTARDAEKILSREWGNARNR